MATALYGKGRAAFGNKKIDWTNDNIRLIFADSGGYTVSINTDEFLDNGSPVIPSAARIGVSAATLANKTNTLGVMDADDHTINSVTGVQFEAIVFYLHTGVETTSYLIAYVDNYTGLPCTPNGGNITVSFPSDANKIFKL